MVSYVVFLYQNYHCQIFSKIKILIVTFFFYLSPFTCSAVSFWSTYCFHSFPFLILFQVLLTMTAHFWVGAHKSSHDPHLVVYNWVTAFCYDSFWLSRDICAVKFRGNYNSLLLYWTGTRSGTNSQMCFCGWALLSGASFLPHNNKK